MEVTSPQRRRRDRPGSQSHRLRRQDDRNVFLMRGRAAPPASQAQAPHSKEHIPDLGNKKRAPASLEPVCFFMVGMARFERAASASRTLRSSQTEPHPVARGNITPKPPSMQAFLQKNFSGHLRPFRSRGISGKTFGNIGQLGFDFIKKGATTLMPVRLPGKNLFEVALCRTQDPRTISATARN